MENKQNLSKLKKQDLLNKKVSKAISAESDLADDLIQKKGSKTDPSNKKLDAEGYLYSDMPRTSKKGTSSKKMSGEKSLQDTPTFKKLTTKKSGTLEPEKNLADDLSFKKGGKTTPSNTKLDSEKFLSDNFHYVKGFNSFVNENYEREEESGEENEEECSVCNTDPCICDTEEKKKK